MQSVNILSSVIAVAAVAAGEAAEGDEEGDEGSSLCFPQQFFLPITTAAARNDGIDG